MNGWPPTEDEAKELPVDVLGLRLLVRVRDGGKTTLNNVAANLRSEADVRRQREEQAVGTVVGRSDVSMGQDYELAISEAWHWLIGAGLLTEIPMEKGWFVPSRLGRKVLDETPDPVQYVRAEQRIGLDLHPRIRTSVRPQFLLGEYDAAVLIAMRTVEERVRELASAANEDIGVNLMKKAFAKKGPLRDESADAGEADAQMALFWGAIGVFKNPASHRRVHYEDVTEAAEAVLFADLLLRMLDRV